jgi:glucosylceramidase
MTLQRYILTSIILPSIMICGTFILFDCNSKPMKLEIYQTSRDGLKCEKINQEIDLDSNLSIVELEIFPEQEFQIITGFGGSFSEASCHLLSKMSPENRSQILNAYFSKEGANYSLTRTTMASSDFSLKHYTYASVGHDTSLKHFTIAHDQQDIIPIIKQALQISNNKFKIIASPWTCPPWMKDNNHWVGGKLLTKYYATFALYFEKYLEAYKKEGIDIWGLTVINEPHGNGNNWESTHFSPKEMTDFVEFNLGPQLEKSKWGHVRILGYDQNRAGLKEWVDEMYRSESSSKYFAGAAIHWYESTYDYFPNALDYAYTKKPGKHLIQTEACIDAEVPRWKNDDWYWQKEATDWGWDWASEADKHLHPKYAPVHRYATDIIGCLNHGVDGWVDWNMVLDKQGGPNWFKNWCIAPIIADTQVNEVYFTPLYYVMKHFSKFIRPEAKRIALKKTNDSEIMATAIQNPDKSIIVVLFNPTRNNKTIALQLDKLKHKIALPSESLQSIIIDPT